MGEVQSIKTCLDDSGNNFIYSLLLIPSPGAEARVAAGGLYTGNFR